MHPQKLSEKKSFSLSHPVANTQPLPLTPSLSLSLPRNIHIAAAGTAAPSLLLAS